MKQFVVESVINNSLKKLPSVLDNIIKEADSTSNITPYNSLISKVIKRASLTSALPYFCTIIPASTPEGKIPVMTGVLTGNNSQAVSVLQTLRILQVPDASGFTVDGVITSSGSGAGKVLYLEEVTYTDTLTPTTHTMWQVLISVTSGVFAEGESIDAVSPYATPLTTITNVLFAVDGVGNILRNYTGDYSVTDGEGLGITAPFKKMDNKLYLTQINCVSKKIKSGYTLELLQDAFSMYKENYEEVLVNTLSNRINNEIEQKVIDFMIANAYQQPAIALVNSYGTATSLKAVFEDIYSRINRSMQRLGTNSSINGPYFVIASSNVVGALDTVKAVNHDIDYSIYPENTRIQGFLKNGAILIQDPYAVSDYFIVGIAGSEELDNGAVIYAPYLVDILQATDPNTFEEYIGIMNRHDVINSPLATKTNIQGKNEMIEITYLDFTGLTNY